MRVKINRLRKGGVDGVHCWPVADVYLSTYGLRDAFTKFFIPVAA